MKRLKSKLKWIWRSIKELIWPALECERVGHEWFRIEVSGFIWPSENPPCVADEIRMTVHECARCRARQRLDIDEVLEFRSLHMLSLPEKQWVKLKRDRFLQTDEV